MLTRNNIREATAERIAGLESLVAFARAQCKLFRPKCPTCPRNDKEWSYWDKVTSKWESELQGLKILYNKSGNG